MKIAIFDGILETHLGSSFERALVARGHSVFNTGKIGHGFKFPTSTDTIDHLEVAVARVLAFKPDVIFVMRPASLPFPLLEKLKTAKATLVAWFSDDPVLYDLSYGPVVSSYDLILHCGNSTVLKFYEQEFGRPTGVNFPFWTDHEAFPYVWGTAPQTTDMMFLGNVHDEVRRARYFTLATLEAGIRIHGNVATDYHNLSGGYLLTDAEVVSAGSTAKLALNIPQFFKDHRGLDTWFPGLDKLGFFEYPSRVIQYMAMGIPTISVVPGKPKFRSYPEMFVAETIQEAGEIAKSLILSDQLQSLSEAVASRFDRSFSAMSRVLFLESLLENDSWQSLSPDEREVYFENFDGRSVEKEISTETISIKENNPCAPGTPKRVLLFGNELGRDSSRGCAVGRWLETNGYSVTRVKAGAYLSVLQEDPQQVCKFALNLHRLNKFFDLRDFDYLCVVGIEAAITTVGSQLLSECNTKSIFFDDKVNATLRYSQRLFEGYSYVGTPRFAHHQKLSELGFSNSFFAPHFVNPDYLPLVSQAKEAKNLLRVRQNEKVEEAVCPAYISDTSNIAEQDILEFDYLRTMTLEELAVNLKRNISLVSYSGSRSVPVIDPIVPYVVVGARTAFLSRNAVFQHIHPYQDLSPTVTDQGELFIKSHALKDGGYKYFYESEARRSASALIKGSYLQQVFGDEEVQNKTPRAIGLQSGQEFALEIHGESASSATTWLINFEPNHFVGSAKDWWIQIKLNNSALYGFHPSKSLSLCCSKKVDKSAISVIAKYIGKSRIVNANHAVQCEVTISPFPFQIPTGKQKLIAPLEI